MTNYSCPSCGTSDPNAFINCHRPDCPDGRDPRPKKPEVVQGVPVMYVNVLFVGEGEEQLTTIKMDLEFIFSVRAVKFRNEFYVYLRTVDKGKTYVFQRVDVLEIKEK